MNLLNEAGKVSLSSGNTTITTILTDRERKLINEIEQLIMHAEEDTLDYSVLEHARKLVFTIQNQKS